MRSAPQSRRPHRLRRAVAAATVLVAAGSTVAATGGPDPYPAPGPVPELSPATLTARYAAAERDIERARDTAEQVHDGDRARALSAFLRPGRRFLSFDARGRGRVVEVIGDLARADRIAVVVPGADGLLTNFDSWKWAGGGSRALHRQAAAAPPGKPASSGKPAPSVLPAPPGTAGSRLAVVAWLGYDSPSTLSTEVLTSRNAAEGARGLHRLVGGLHRVNGRAGIGLLCHSYGSVVCGKAAGRLAGLPVDEIALYGSPGTTVRSAAALKTPARVWAGRASGDWTRFVPKARFAGIGFGADPVSPAFGASRFDAGTGPHSAYLKPGSAPLRNLALIALGRDSEVTRA